MSILVRVLIFFSSLGIGLAILKYTHPLINLTGSISWAERYLSLGASGGTYNFWKLVGVLVIVAGLIIAVKGWSPL